MVRPFPSHHIITSHFSSIPLAIGLFASIFALVALCAKSSKSRKSRYRDDDLYEPPKSPLATPKRIIASINSNMKASNSNSSNNKMKKGNNGSEVGDDKISNGFGEGGLWQKNILMGEKCQPLEFSGVIYYDNYGNRTPEIPRSPRASAAAPNGFQTSFSFPLPSRYSG